jgi:alpha-D-xyloside xylohydrolase
VDFSNPEAVEWYKSKHRPLLEMGVATFKSDFGEMIPYDAHFFNGKTGREMHNVYPLLYNRAVFEVIQEYQERPVVWGRSGYAGSQKYPVQWSGDPLADFNSLSATVRGGLCYGLSGVPFWTFDLGGFKGEPTIEAYIRWAQTGLLISHSRFHGTTPRLPWYFGDRAVEIIKKYVHLRYRLLPYLYAVAWEAVRTGVPVMRALGLEFPNDPGSLANETEFLLGSSLLVAPVLNAEGEVDVYLPPGTWYDYWNEQKHQGPAQIHRSCDMEDYPLYIRSTAVLPVSDDSSTVSDLWDPLVFELYPAAEGAFEIPEEEGRQSTYFAVSKKCSVTKIEARGPERKWRVVLHDVVETQEVTISAPVRGDWRYNQKTRTLQITVEKCDHLEIDTYWIG